MDSHPTENNKVWQKVLAEGERIEHSFSIGKTYIKVNLILCLIIIALFFFLSLSISNKLAFVAVVLFLIALAYFSYIRIANAFAFTNKRVLVHRGWLSTHTTSIDYDKITEVSVTEPFSERLFTKSGSLLIHTASTLVDPAILKHVEAPYELKKNLDSIRKS